MTTVKIRIKFEESILGSLPGNEKIFDEFIASKSPDASTREEEIAAIGADSVLEKGTTVFPRNAEGQPCLYDYQIKGFFKDACSMLKRVPGKKSEADGIGTNSASLKAFKKEIDGLIFVEPRLSPITMSGDMTICQRPLRAQTMQGERVALASSEEIPAGSTVDFDIILMRDDLWNCLEEWLDYGRFRGLGQWRNGGHGKFTYEVLD